MSRGGTLTGMTSPVDDGARVANAEQAAAWNGPEGASWAEHSADRAPDGDLIDLLLGAAAVPPDVRVLDIGCGTGELTRQAARRAGRGLALGVDLSAHMIELARRESEAQGVANAVFEVGDAQTHAFARASFDLALSHFGTMFFADPTAAFRNIARALQPDGRLWFVCPQAMDRCDWYTVPLAALIGRAPDAETAPSAMFSLADAATVQRVLTAAGLHPVGLTPVEQTLWFGADVPTAVDGFLGAGPVRAIVERDPALTADQARARLEAALAPYLTADGVRIPGAYWLVESTPVPDGA